MAFVDHPEQEKRLSHLQQRFRAAELRGRRSQVWRQVGSISRTCALVVLGAALGSGTFLALDMLTPATAGKDAFTSRGAYYRNCREAFQDGRANIRRGEPGYRMDLDADGDGLACEPFRR